MNELERNSWDEIFMRVFEKGYKIRYLGMEVDTKMWKSDKFKS